MVKPSPALYGRLRFTTKQVGRGFYRGNRTGSMGAHTEYGGYLIDWRKTKHFNVPDTADFALSPFITQVMEPTPRVLEGPDGALYTPKRVDGLEFLRSWKKLNPYEFDGVVTEQRKSIEGAEGDGESEIPVSEQIQEPAREQIYTQGAESGRNPFQQQTRQMHTSSRRLEAAQEPISSDLDLQPPSTKEWLEMSRQERKELINTVTRAKIRALKKDDGWGKLSRDEKNKIKHFVKLMLRRALVGTGVFTNEEEYRRMLSAEGQARKQKGLPKWTVHERLEFLLDLVQKSGDVDGVFKEILQMPAEELLKPRDRVKTKQGTGS